MQLEIDGIENVEEEAKNIVKKKSKLSSKKRDVTMSVYAIQNFYNTSGSRLLYSSKCDDCIYRTVRNKIARKEYLPKIKGVVPCGICNEFRWEVITDDKKEG